MTMHEPRPEPPSRLRPFRLRSSATLALTLVLLAGRPAGADPPEPQQPAPAPATAQGHDSGHWGWWVLGGGLVAGAALTTYGLTIDCATGDDGCGRRASLPIWGGIGLAALASGLGLAVVETGRQRGVQVVPAVSLDPAAPRIGLVLRAPLWQ
jgi:hypothetical protein